MSSVKGQGMGNQHNLKFKTSEARKEMARRYRKHCEEGLSDEAFEIDPDTLKSYIIKYPDDLASIKESRVLRRHFWEKMGNAGALGRIPNFNSTAWIFNMKNRFGWRDKTEITGKDGEDLTVNVNIVPQKKKTYTEDSEN